MSAVAPESFKANLVPNENPSEASSLSILDIEAVVVPDLQNPGAKKEETITGVHVIEKGSEQVMVVKVEPSGFAHYALEAILKDNRRARIFPMHNSQEWIVGISPLPTPAKAPEI